MMESLFGNSVIEKVLFYLLINQRSYGTEMSRKLATPLYSVQLALDRLEKGGILARQAQGRTQLYMFNPRYPFLEELSELLSKALNSLPDEIKKKYEDRDRKRPRRRRKPF